MLERIEIEENPTEFFLSDSEGRNINASIVSVKGRFGIGCQGIVMPADMTTPEGTRRVQVKQFFKHSHDDRGEPFDQDPDEMAEESFKSLLLLRELGFDVLPYFGLAKSKDGHFVLVMTDLTEYGTKEIIDEKDFESDGNYIDVNGEEKNARKAYENIANKKEVMMKKKKNGWLTFANNMFLGNGVSRMIVRDPVTNMMDVFISDVGEVGKKHSPYINIVSNKEMSAIPNEEIRDVFGKMMSTIHPGVDANKIFNDYVEKFPKRKEFQDLLYKVMMGCMLARRLDYESYNDMEFAKLKFGKKYPDLSSIIQYKLEDFERDYSEIGDGRLFDLSKKSLAKFLDGKYGNGIDFAFMAVIDKRIQYLIEARNAVDNNEDIPKTNSVIAFNKDGLPKMEFLEYGGKDLEKTVVVELYALEGTSYNNARFSLGNNVKVLAEIGWEDAYDYVWHLRSFDKLPIIKKEQIKGIKINGRKMKDFDPSLIKRDRENEPLVSGDFALAYRYGEKIIYVHYLIDKSENEIEEINKKLGMVS
jgi:hypothetical protein